MTTAVVYVHGLWLTGVEGSLLRRRLARDLGARTFTFSYPSLRLSVAANAASLALFLSEISAETLHLVGHSLGGLVILRMFEDHSEAQLPPGRIVLLGSPLQGSRTAQRVAELPLGRWVIGNGARAELLGRRERGWTGPRQLGVIAGNLSVGLGRLVGRHDMPSDGTVFLDETLLNGASDRWVEKVSHTGLPFSKEVARQTSAFLRMGRFSR